MASNSHTAAYITKKIAEAEKMIKDLQDQYEELVEERYSFLGEAFTEAFEGCQDFDVARDNNTKIRSFMKRLRDLYEEDEYIKHIDEKFELENMETSSHVYVKNDYYGF